MVLSRNVILEEVVSTLKGLKGVLQVAQLKWDELARIMELEKQAEARVMPGLGKGLNIGVREVLRREAVLAIITSVEFKWPPEPAVRLVYNGVTVGEEIKDEDKLKEYERDANVFIAGSFAIFKDKLRAVGKPKEALMVFPPLSFKQLSSIKEITDVVAASPSPPVDLFIKERVGIRGEGIGTMLIGFNFKEDVKECIKR